MATLSKFDRSDIRKARKAGFKRKVPKKGKLKTMGQMESYIERWNNWVRDAKEKIKDYNQKISDKEKLKKFRNKLR